MKSHVLHIVGLIFLVRLHAGIFEVDHSWRE